MRNHVCVLLTVLIVLVANASYAQTVGAGVKAGIDFSSLPNAGEMIDQVVKQGSTESSSKVGAVLGGFVIFPIARHVAFQPELTFVMKGVKLSEAGGGTLSATLRYLEFPILVRYGVAVGTHTAYFLVGPAFGVKAGTSAQFDGSNQTIEANIDSSIRSFDAGIAFGGGIEHGRYLVEGRYTQGLSDIGTDAFPHADALRNRVFAILVGVRLK